MNIQDRFKNVSVVGAAGKMGSGIALLMAYEMMMQKLKPENQNTVYRLNLVDMNDDALSRLMQYLKIQLIKKAEKSTVLLRELYSDRGDLVENGEIINQYVEDALSLIRIGTNIDIVAKSSMVFEAIVENIDIKIRLLKQLNDICSKETYFFSNTSSIPISLLNEGANLEGRLTGFHFYNPPAVQKLAEIIPATSTRNELKELSLEIGKRLNKKIFLAADIAGFIGNGHFLRDALHATSEVKRLTGQFKQYEAIYLINKISQALLLRPMGIFQLIDYVGIDVMVFISRIMDKYIENETLSDELINTMYEKKILGGQRADGSQKDGFFKYDRNRPVGVYDLTTGQYNNFENNSWTKALDNKIGAYPGEWAPWKTLLSIPEKDEKLKTYFSKLLNSGTFGAELAIRYLKRSKEIGLQLVEQGVAASADDVNGVLMNGFYHLYGPVNDYI